MSFDLKNVAIEDLNKGSMQILKTMRLKNKIVRKIDLIQGVAENLIRPIKLSYDIVNSEYLFEQRNLNFRRPRDITTKEEMREKENNIVNELKDSLRDSFTDKLKVIYNLGYGHRVHEAVYTINRNNMSKTKYLMILRIAEELIAEFLRNELLRTLKNSDKDCLPYKNRKTTDSKK